MAKHLIVNSSSVDKGVIDPNTHILLVGGSVRSRKGESAQSLQPGHATLLGTPNRHSPTFARGDVDRNAAFLTAARN